MPDQLDARIRAWVLEVVDSAPPTPPFDEIESDSRQVVVGRRSARRRPLVAAIAACLAVALVIGGWLLFSRNDPSSVQTPTRPPPTAPATGTTGGCAGQAYVANRTDGTVSVITTATGAVSAPIKVGTAPIGVAICPAPSAKKR
jgi:YVTN family beta-propeller protein